jgi:hypothetical protein
MVITLEDESLLVTARYIVEVDVVSLLNPSTPGVINCVSALDVVIISAITPLPGNGSLPSVLLASAVLLVASEYKRTQAG